MRDAMRGDEDERRRRRDPLYRRRDDAVLLLYRRACDDAVSCERVEAGQRRETPAHNPNIP